MSRAAADHRLERDAGIGQVVDEEHAPGELAPGSDVPSGDVQAPSGRPLVRAVRTVDMIAKGLSNTREHVAGPHAAARQA